MTVCSRKFLYLGSVFLLYCLSWAFADFAVANEEGAAGTGNDVLILDLPQIIDQVRSGNRFLLQNGLLVENSRYSQQSARAEFDWKVRPVANFGLSGSDNSTEQATGISGEISKKNSYGITTSFTPTVAYVNTSDTVSSGVGVSLSIPLFRGFGEAYNMDSVYSADFSLKSSIRSVYRLEVEKVLETISLVYEVVRQKRLIDLYAEQNRRLEKHVVTIRLMEDTGLGNQIDTYRAQIRQKDVQDQLAVAKQQYQNALDRLNVLLALPVETRLELDIPLSYEFTTITECEAEVIALENRIEIEQAAADLAEAKRKARLAEQKILPDLNFVASYRKNTFLEGLDASESYYGDYWSIGITSNTDLARSSEKAAYQQSLLNVRRKNLNQESLQDTVRTEVRNLLNELKKEAQSIALRQEQILQATGKRKLAEIKFSHGMGGNFDFIESDTELQQARANLLRGKVSYIVGQYRLRASLGTLITR